jgi:hypothetical protein
MRGKSVEREKIRERKLGRKLGGENESEKDTEECEGMKISGSGSTCVTFSTHPFYNCPNGMN